MAAVYALASSFAAQRGTGRGAECGADRNFAGESQIEHLAK
jgi:hypothetical protein